MSADVREFERLLRRYMLATKRAQMGPTEYGATRSGNPEEKRRKRVAIHRRFELMEFVRSRLAICNERGKP